ncbi:MAG: hypothetical protein A2170_01270 [Deltaproteobacteria bacterium RBG_13_53_10]|nr:MAG: hypothetical protein A2170_01270 [Deltaproteobacteria bacterium RBG_13_53_10]
MRPGRLSRIVVSPETPALLRGEIWVSPDVLAEAGFDRGPKGLVRFASSIGAHISFFHWPESVMLSDLNELLELAHAADVDCGLTINGPFQRLTLIRNVLDLLQELHRDPSHFEALLAREMEEIAETLDFVKGSEIELIMITEDVAYTGGLYFSPEVFRKVLVPFYSSLVSQLSSTRIALGWHSDGDVSPLLPDLVECGLRFFSLEPECVDLLEFKQTYRSRVSLVGGIRATWFAGKQLDQDEERHYLLEIGALLNEGGLILASSCGLNSPAFLLNLRHLYRLAEGLIPSSA